MAPLLDQIKMIISLPSDNPMLYLFGAAILTVIFVILISDRFGRKQ